MIRAAAAFVSMVIAFAIIGWLAYGFSAITGQPIFEQSFWEVTRGALVITGVLAGFAALVLGAAWLLLSDRSPIPAVRARWTRHLTPDRAVSRTPRAAAHGAPTSQEGTQS